MGIEKQILATYRRLDFKRHYLRNAIKRGIEKGTILFHHNHKNSYKLPPKKSALKKAKKAAPKKKTTTRKTATSPPDISDLEANCRIAQTMPARPDEETVEEQNVRIGAGFAAEEQLNEIRQRAATKKKKITKKKKATKQLERPMSTTSSDEDDMADVRQRRRQVRMKMIRLMCAEEMKEAIENGEVAEVLEMAARCGIDKPFLSTPDMVSAGVWL